MIKSRYIYLIAILIIGAGLFKTGNAYGQDRLYGQLFEYKTRKHLGDIRVQNINNSAVTMSDTAGRFSIPAKKGDRILYSGQGYLPDTVYLINLKYTEIFLRVNMLEQVNVVSTKTQLGSLKAAPVITPFGGNSVVYQTDKNGNFIGGIALKIYNNRGSRDKKKVEDLQQEEKIGQIFSADNLQKYLPITGQELTNFIILYTPDIKTYKEIDNLTVYLNTCYKEFLTIPAEKRQSKEFLDLNSIK